MTKQETSLLSKSGQIQQVEYGGDVFAIIVPSTYHATGIQFFTPGDFSQQLAYMCHSTGKEIEPHIHNAVAREVQLTQEALFIRRGRLRVDFYDTDRRYLESRVLEAGDTILLIQGGHGFEVLEDVEMIEIKQGPYVGDHDKTRFPGIESQAVKLSR